MTGILGRPVTGPSKRPWRNSRLLICLTVLSCTAAIILVSLDAWGLHLFGTKRNVAQFGTWSEFLAGMGATAAFLVSAGAIIYDREMRRAQEASRQFREETDVYSWLTFKEMADPDADTVTEMRATLIVANDTGRTVRDWYAKLEGVPDHWCSRLDGPLNPGQTRLRVVEFADPTRGNSPPVLVRFASRSGGLWLRDGVGNLFGVSGPLCGECGQPAAQEQK